MLSKIFLGKLFIVIGVLSFVIGTAILLDKHIPFINKIGHLPGDLVFRYANIQFYIPITTGVILSALASAIIYFLKK